VETLQKQFQIVKSETHSSHVMEYGDMVSSYWLSFDCWSSWSKILNYKL